MNPATLLKMWQLIIEHDVRKNMAHDFSGEALESMVSAIVDATVVEPVDVNHCITNLDNGEVVAVITQKNGLIVGRIQLEGK